MNRRGIRNEYIVSHDGQRILALDPIADRRTSPVTPILNWPALVE